MRLRKRHGLPTRRCCRATRTLPRTFILWMLLATCPPGTKVFGPIIEESSSLTGTAVVFVVDHRNGSSETKYALQTDHGLLHLTFAEPPRIHSGRTLRIVGQRDGRQVTVDDWSAVPEANTVAAAGTSPNLGEQHMLVLLVNFQDDTSEPATIADVENVVYNVADENSWDFWIREASYGRAFLTGDVFGWYTLPYDTGTLCDPEALLYAAMDAVDAADPAIDFTGYRRLAVITPNMNCTWKGAGTVGIPALVTPDGATEMSVFELNGVGAAFDGAAVHEFGHNLGLRHAAAWECGASPIIGLCAALYPNYDNLDTLGTESLKGHYSAPHKETAGWLEPGEIITTNTPGVYQLTPMSVAGGVKTLKIPIAGGYHYYVEYRQPLNHDASVLAYVQALSGGGPALAQGAIIHLDLLYQSTSLTADTQLLDLSPGQHADSQIDAADSALKVGQVFEDPDNGVYLQVLSATPQRLTVCLGESACAAPQIIPAASSWTVLILALLLLTAGSALARRRVASCLRSSQRGAG